MIRALAHEIWHAHYPGIITVAQIDYMLARGYAADVLHRELTAGGTEYWLLEAGGAPAGYAALGPRQDDGAVKLHKLYLRPAWHGRGLGARLLRHAADRARALGGRTLYLTVAKSNHRAIAAYERAGFTRTGDVVIDIGGGFVMDDHVMTRLL